LLPNNELIQWENAQGNFTAALCMIVLAILVSISALCYKRASAKVFLQLSTMTLLALGAAISFFSWLALMSTV
jgi:uncharacterized membrane protein YoaK (UPF0700 family)